MKRKQSGKYKKWVNVHVEGNKELWDCVKDKNGLPYQEKAAMLTADQEMVNSKDEEPKSLINNDVLEIIPL